MTNFTLWCMSAEGQFYALGPIMLEETDVPASHRAKYQRLKSMHKLKGIPELIVSEILKTPENPVNLRPVVEDYYSLLTFIRVQTRKLRGQECGEHRVFKTTGSRYSSMAILPDTLGTIIVALKHSGPKKHCAVHVYYHLDELFLEKDSKHHLNRVYTVQLNSLPHPSPGQQLAREAPSLLACSKQQLVVRSYAHIYRLEIRALLDLDEHLGERDLMGRLAELPARLTVVLKPADPACKGYLASLLLGHDLLLIRKEEAAMGVYYFQLQLGSAATYLEDLVRQYNLHYQEYQKALLNPRELPAPAPLALPKSPEFKDLTTFEKALKGWQERFFEELGKYVARLQAKYQRLQGLADSRETEHSDSKAVNAAVRDQLRRVQEKNARIGTLSARLMDAGQIQTTLSGEELADFKRDLAHYRDKFSTYRTVMKDFRLGATRQEMERVDKELA
jgi:hypothetical protein